MQDTKKRNGQNTVFLQHTEESVLGVFSMALGGVPDTEIIKIMATAIRPLLAKLMDGKQLKAHETELLLLYSLVESQNQNSQQMLMLRRDFETMVKRLDTACQTMTNIQLDVSRLMGRGDGKQV